MCVIFMDFVVKVIFADDATPTIYVTTNEGEEFKAYDVPVDPKTMKPHPTMAGWLLGHDPNQVCICTLGMNVENTARSAN